MDRAFTSASSPMSSIGCVQNDFCADGTFGANFAPILHRHKHCLQLERREIPQDPRHLGVPSGASKMVSEPMVCLTQTVHLSCVKITLYPKGRNELPLEPRHLVVPATASKTIYKPMVRLAQTMHLSCTDTNTVFKQKEARFHMTHVT